VASEERKISGQRRMRFPKGWRYLNRSSMAVPRLREGRYFKVTKVTP
jgi:hypothetical protein